MHLRWRLGSNKIAMSSMGGTDTNLLCDSLLALKLEQLLGCGCQPFGLGRGGKRGKKMKRRRELVRDGSEGVSESKAYSFSGLLRCVAHLAACLGLGAHMAD